MKLDYITINKDFKLEDKIPTCQCKTKMVYWDKLDKIICPNENCIKHRMESVMSTLRALDKKAQDSNLQLELEKNAKKNYDLLVEYVLTCNIKYGAELITLGNDLSVLGLLGTQLGQAIDKLTFELQDLSKICGSQLLEKFNVDFTKINIYNERQALANINVQLGIDNTISLAKLLYDDYLIYKPLIFSLADYLTLIKLASLKRSTVPLVINKDSDRLQTNTKIKEDLNIVDILSNSSVTSTLENYDTNFDNGTETASADDILEW